MTIIHDEQERTRALNASKSFIVQAPAGSGKTELLIQRFLVLLGHVKQPEEILAITFTRKSAGEMRMRIINALQNARDNPEPQAAHAKKTWLLARAVLNQDKLLGWNLLSCPNRLRMQTIDSLNASLTRQLPILSHFGAAPDITHDAWPLYRKAAQEFLSHLEEDQEWSDAIATILLHMDNDLNKVESLLVNLLAKRDQWLRHIALNATDTFLREKLESQLAYVVTDILTRLKNNFPAEYTNELLTLSRYASSQAIHDFNDCQITSCIDIESLPDDTLEDLEKWLGIREMLFTKNNEWRKKFDKNIGFYPATFYKNTDEKNQAVDMKSRVSALVHQLTQFDKLRDIFTELNNAPDTFYREQQWQTLEALHHVLRVVAAQLNVVFQQHGKIDYIENSLAALAALGTDEAPTDLTLALDYQIKHILIDEFQDTSNSQYQLLKKITAGWEPNDGRTLFLVGDPMQSIYRFREAEVGIFLRARQHGIGNIKLESLVLSVNFRSTSGIVNWINEQFPTVFPGFYDIATGAVPYSPGIAFQEQHTTEPVISLNAFSSQEISEQANAILELIRKRKKLDPNGTIAILVRSRTHLEDIIPVLKNAGIRYRAIDIDPLTQRPFIRDLIALTRAMLHLGDRIAWLAILRAPWCGLSLSDLLALTGDHSTVGLWERLQSLESVTLSTDGQKRLERFLTVMKIKIAERQRYSLRAWIESTWLLLGGPACVEDANHLNDAAAYFNLLTTLDQNGEIDTDSLDEYANELFAAPDNQADNTLQIMTIHNAKGLEFDTVILPHLERKSSVDDKQLLLWIERTRLDESSSLILAPINAIGDDSDSIYEYIKRENSIKNDYERGRLLYVAVTRAKKNLDLFFSISEGNKIYSGSLLEKLWPSIQNKIQLTKSSQSYSLEEIENEYKPLELKRLPVEWRNPVSEDRLAEKIAYQQKKIGFLLPDNTAKHTGTIVHRILQQISLLNAEWWLNQPSGTKHSWLKVQLVQLGANKNHLEVMIKNIEKQISHTLNDPRGCWILKKHSHAQAEFRLTTMVDSKAKQFIIDRTFVDENNIRWIIDYKTALPAFDEDLQIFLQNEFEKYQEQMWYYFRAIREIDQRPVRMGLYFPAIPAWHEWDFEKEITT